MKILQIVLKTLNGVPVLMALLTTRVKHVAQVYRTVM